MPSSCQSSLFCRWQAVSWSNPAMEKLLHNFSMMMTTCHCIETLTHWSGLEKSTISSCYTNILSTNCKSVKKQNTAIKTVSESGQPNRSGHSDQDCAPLRTLQNFVQTCKNEHFVEFQFYLTPLWADFQSCWIISLHDECSGLGAMPIGHALFRVLLFVIQQFHCQTFWFKWCGRFSEYFLAFCFFSIKTDSLSVSLSWVTGTNIKTHPIQCNTHIK